ncbi:MAG: cadmium-translocating P-type ATPase [Clostridiaceae bacterium]|nr:cadmium-translocating P-type ATPase [Clostridiaceae bacterium]
MTKNEKHLVQRLVWTLILSVVLFLLARSFNLNTENNITIFYYNSENLWLLIASLLIYLLIGYDIIWKAIRNIFQGTIFDENFLMTIATIGAFLIGQYSEGIAVMLFYQIGELLQRSAVNKSRKSIGELMDIAPEYANIVENGELIQVDPYDVSIGDYIVVLPGERMPLDGIVSEGNSSLDTSALTGESLPIDIAKGDQVFSGSINLSGKIIIQVEKEYDDSTVANILELVENATNQKAEAEVFATTFARYYTPVVFFAAIALAVIPTLFFGQNFAIWLERALIFLVVSCPCALVVSIPLTFFSGIGAASKIGVLVKGSNYLEYLAKVKTIVFDKTGTLTYGKFQVANIKANGISKEELLKLASHAEYFSNHPIAKSIVNSYPKNLNPDNIQNAQEISGQGIKAEYQGKELLVGNKTLMLKHQIDILETAEIGSIVYVALDGDFLGSLTITDRPKENANETIKELRNLGINQIMMLTGDRDLVAAKIADELAIDHYYAELLPQDKVKKLEEIIKDKDTPKDLVAYVGDGINDAPVLALADVGIAMGNLGSDAAIEAADTVIMQDELNRIADAIKVGRKTLRIAIQNLVIALSIKIIILILATFGFANLWLAVFGDVGVTIIAVTNALRALMVK